MAYKSQTGDRPLRSSPPSTLFDNTSGGGSRNSNSNKDAEEYVEITVDVSDDTISIHDIKGGEGFDQEMALLAKNLDRPAGRMPAMARSLSARLKQATSEMRRVVSSSRRAEDGPVLASRSAQFQVQSRRRLDRSMTEVSKALKGLQFVTRSVVTQGWSEVEKRFDKLAVDEMLLRTRF